MNSPLKFDQDPLKFDPGKRPDTPDLQFERSDYRADYGDLAVRTLASIVRHGGFIVSIVAFALVLACISIPLMPRKYSAEAIVYPNLFSREQGRPVALASIDAASLVNGEARLISSDAILRAVAMRLGNDPEAAPRRSWATGLDWLRTAVLPETRNHSPLERTVAMLRNKVTVMHDTRSYLISISFTASSADEAAQVVNAIVIEYLRDKAKQRWLNKVSELREQLAIYGKKHPKSLQALAELDADRASFQAAMNPQYGSQEEVANDRSIKLALPNHTPTSPKGFVILGLAFVSALLAGIGLAVWRDRRDAKGKSGASQRRRRA